MDDLTPAERVARLRMDQAAASRRRNLFIAVAVVGVLALLITIGLVVQHERDHTDEAVQQSPKGVTSGYGVLLGKKDAPHSVVVYEDFQCPICNEFEKLTSKKVQAAVKAGKISLEYRMVSFLDRASKNDYSSRAANAAAAVFDTAGPAAFAKFHAELFAHQPAEGTAGPTDKQLIADAIEAGAPSNEVTSLVNGGAYVEWVAAATEAMSRAGVTGTPTVLIDGKTAGSNPAEAADALLKLVK